MGAGHSCTSNADCASEYHCEAGKCTKNTSTDNNIRILIAILILVVLCVWVYKYNKEK